jgi:beta-glucosidase
VLGRLAAVPNLGDGGSSDVRPPAVVPLLDGIRIAFAGAEVVAADDDASVASGADLAVVVVGFTKADEGEYVDSRGTAGLEGVFPPRPEPPIVPTPVTPDRAMTREDPVAPNQPVTRAQQRQPAEADFSSPGGDRRSLRLHAGDEDLIAATLAVCPHIVVVVMGGSATVMPWLDDVPAALLVWYPGMEGGRALGDVLTGAAEPGGRLPFALPRDESHLVPFDPDADTATYDLFHGQWKLDRDGVEPHRPFGAGLGYTTFEVGGAEVAHTPAGWSGDVVVRVTNTGRRPGATVVQVYGSKLDSRYERPLRRLVGFGRVELAAGEVREVAVPYDLASLAVREHGAWVHEPGAWRLTVGQHAHDAAAVIDLNLEGGP